MANKKAKKPGSARAKSAKSKRSSSRKASASRKAAKAKPTTKKTAKAKPAPKKAVKAQQAAKKQPAKKAASAKPAAKKATKAKPVARKTTQQAPSKPKTTRSTRKSTVKSPFKVRDRVVYPHHGAALITKKEKRELDGEMTEYFVIEAITNPLTLRIPVERASDLGLRPVISKNAARKVFAVLKEEPIEADATWARWFKLLQDKMSSGDIYEVASVVRDLTYAQQSKPLGPALKRMLAKARLILTSELQLALDIDEEASVKRLDRALTHLIIDEETAEVG